jgi:TetR/AcrR family transcriptional regulator, transcriptional repressor for nem operon
MRYEKGHKENTRKHILEVASKRFRRDGASASGLAGIMAAAGLTNGAFYPHFESKEALLREALVDALTEQDEVASSEVGCPSAALLPEISRQPERTRKAYEDALLAYISALATHLPDSGSSDGRAMAIFSLMVGTLQIARAVADTSLAQQILEGGVEAALILAGKS